MIDRANDAAVQALAGRRDGGRTRAERKLGRSIVFDLIEATAQLDALVGRHIAANPRKKSLEARRLHFQPPLPKSKMG